MLGKKLVARAFASVAIAFVSVAGAGAAEAAQTITRAACEATPGAEVVDHGAWEGCRGIAPYDIKIVG